MQQLSLFGLMEESKPVDPQPAPTADPAIDQKINQHDTEPFEEMPEAPLEDGRQTDAPASTNLPDLKPDEVEDLEPEINVVQEDSSAYFTNADMDSSLPAPGIDQNFTENILPTLTASVPPKKSLGVKPATPLTVGNKKKGRKSFKEMDAELDMVEIPENEVLFQKQYYPISLVAQWFGVNTSLLRFWDNEFDILKPRKNKKGDRLFRPEDVKNLQVIYYLLRQRKFTIEGARKYMKENLQTADTNIQIIRSLNKFKSFLLELKANLNT